jgi:competence protein ComEC
VVESRAGMRMEWATRGLTLSPLLRTGSSRRPRQLRGHPPDHGSARVLLAGEAEKKSEEYMANGSYTGPLAVLKV